jgi:hypothetical protein
VCLEYSMLSIFLDCLFLIAPSVFLYCLLYSVLWCWWSLYVHHTTKTQDKEKQNTTTLHNTIQKTKKMSKTSPTTSWIFMCKEFAKFLNVCLEYSMLSIFLDCLFLIAPSVFLYCLLYSVLWCWWSLYVHHTMIIK